MDIETETRGGARVIRPQGRVDSNSARELEDALLPCFDTPEPVLVDFTGLSYISSAGLSGMSEPVAEVFTISGFAKLFRIWPDAEAALAELSAG